MVIIATILSVNHHHHHHLQQRNTEQKGAKHIVLVEIVLVGEKFSLGPILQACVPALCQAVFFLQDIPDLLNKLLCHFLFLLLHTFQLSVQT